MSVLKTDVRPGGYYDSIVLMQLQAALAELPGVLDAAAVMATPDNQALLAASGLLPDEAIEAGPADLLVVVRAETEIAAAEALSHVDALLVRGGGAGVEDFQPRSLESALKLLPEARWALISVPGRFAAGVAGEALDRGLHVFLYSDNVSLADEVALKTRGVAEGRLVMGPDCGTAWINGIGLGFANRVRRGAVGLVGASGTGLQAICSHVHALGGGVSHAIGTGGAGSGCGSWRDHLPAGSGPAGPRSRDGRDRSGLEATRSLRGPDRSARREEHGKACRGAFCWILAPGAAAWLPLFRHQPRGSRLDGGRVVEVRSWCSDALARRRQR